MFFLLDSLGSLLWLAFFGTLFYGLWVLVRDDVQMLKGIGPEDLSPVSTILTFILLLAVIILFQQIWSDLGRLAADQAKSYGQTATADIVLRKLLFRAGFVGVVTFIAVPVYFSVKHKGTRFGVITLPYLIVALIFLARLLYEAGKFVLNEYEVYGIYIVLVFIIIIVSALIFVIQKQYEAYKANHADLTYNEEEQIDEARKNSMPQV